MFEMFQVMGNKKTKQTVKNTYFINKKVFGVTLTS